MLFERRVQERMKNSSFFRMSHSRMHPTDEFNKQMCGNLIIRMHNICVIGVGADGRPSSQHGPSFPISMLIDPLPTSPPHPDLVFTLTGSFNSLLILSKYTDQ